MKWEQIIQIIQISIRPTCEAFYSTATAPSQLAAQHLARGLWVSTSGLYSRQPACLLLSSGRSRRVYRQLTVQLEKLFQHRLARRTHGRRGVQRVREKGRGGVYFFISQSDEHFVSLSFVPGSFFFKPFRFRTCVFAAASIFVELQQ